MRDDDITLKQVLGLGFLALFLLFGVTWIAQGNDFFLTKVFAPKYEQVRRETFEQSKAYNQGMIQELQSMQFQYLQAKPEQQDALASIILHRAADYDMDRLPPDLRSFIQGLKTRNVEKRY
jgi:uncharacterized phage-associated protein